MNKPEETIFIIDDDLSVRESISLFLIANGYTVKSFASAEEYIAREDHHGTGCLLLDVKLKGKSGLDVQEQLLILNSQLPIIFITGHGNIQMTVQAMKKGAISFLEKPLKEEGLMQSIYEALNVSRQITKKNEETAKATQLIDSLTSREHEILKYIISGMLYKQIAYELTISEATVKVHRRNICNKLYVKSVPEIIRIAEKAGVISSEKNTDFFDKIKTLLLFI